MHVVIDGGCWRNRRGFGRFTVDIVSAIVRRATRHDVSLVVDFDPRAGEMPDGAAVVRVPTRRAVTESAVAGGRRGLGDMLAFSRTVARARPDLVYYPAVYSFFPAPFRTPCIACFHDTIAEDLPSMIFPDRKSRLAWAAKCRLALWQSKRVMTVSEASRDALVRRFGIAPERIDVVFEGVDDRYRAGASDAELASMRTRLGIPAHRPYLLHVGGLSPHKNLRALLDAMRAACRSVDVTLVLVGDLAADGFMAEGGRLVDVAATDPVLKEHVVFTGFVAEEDLVLLNRGAYAAVIPSLAEGFCLPAAEAIVSGVPVLASSAGALPEVVGDAGVIFDPRDVDAMASEIARIVSDPGLRDSLAARARERAPIFSWDAAADRAIAAFERAVA